MLRRKRSGKFKLSSNNNSENVNSKNSFKQKRSSVDNLSSLSSQTVNENNASEQAHSSGPANTSVNSTVTTTVPTAAYSDPADLIKPKLVDAEEHYSVPYDISTETESEDRERCVNNSATAQNSKLSESEDNSDYETCSPASSKSSSIPASPTVVPSSPVIRSAETYAQVQKRSLVAVNTENGSIRDTNSQYELMESHFNIMMDNDGYSTIEGARPYTSASSSEAGTSVLPTSSPAVPPDRLQETEYGEPWNREEIQRSIHEQVEEALRTSKLSASTREEGIALLSPTSAAHQHLYQFPWYHGRLTREIAERLLTRQPQGSFLVRSSDQADTPYTLSFVADDAPIHMRVARTAEHKLVVGVKKQGRPYESLESLIAAYKQKPLPAKGTKPVKLMHPVPCLSKEF